MIVSEHTEAVIFMRAVRGAEDRWPELALFHAVPNGGKRGKKTAADLKAEGVKAGVPDYCLPVPRGGFHGLYLELKRLAGGRVSREQRDWLAALDAQGYATAVCHGWESAWAAVQDYMAGEWAARAPQSPAAADASMGGVSTTKRDKRPAQGHTGRNRWGA